ncbi:hypothetical protein BpHYR1_017706 [Brachionus plicatilis]|uniref:Uncharacterized protein n=1 Tax=Brachionus plicatilis TaxID=10195 RepID=A0A3M7PQQ9_BRAPC|nr:hypothetical protein BpHYR1_017706 [Brachionus plicatilis]
MNKVNSPRKKQNSNVQDDKNQAFKLIKELLVNKNLEQKRPQFRDAEISPIDLTINRHIKKSAKTPNSKTPSKTPIRDFDENRFDQLKKKSFYKTESNLNSHGKSSGNNNNRADFVKSLVNSTDSSSSMETNANKELDGIYNQMPSLIPSVVKKNESDIKSKPTLFYNYRQCGFKYEDITGSKYGNYFKVNVGAPRNWLKSKFQHRYLNENYMITN